jgi:hypothetical protein
MGATATAPAPTAVRSWNRTGTKATITITYPDGSTRTAGGTRAARAQAVVLACWNDDALGLYGVRGDLHAAQVEAHRLATRTTMRHAGHTFDVSPAREAVAVPVTEVAK